jgi:beta-galactosidase
MTRQIISLNENWQFTQNFSEDIWTKRFPTVRIPHNTKDLPFSYVSSKSFQGVSGYKKKFIIDPLYKGKRFFLHFSGVGHHSKVYLNRQFVGENWSGYNAFEFEITNMIEFGEKNTIVLEVDTRESIDAPPFGGSIDYLTYGGIYREVSLIIVEESYINDVFVKPELGTFTVQTSVKNADGLFLKYGLFDEKGNLVWESGVLPANENQLGSSSVEQVFGFSPKHLVRTDTFSVDGIKLWSLDDPNLYTLKTVLLPESSAGVANSVAAGANSVAAGAAGSAANSAFSFKNFEADENPGDENNTSGENEKKIDEKNTRFGFRTAEWKTDGFYLNGERIQLRGLNRHQSFPFVGYAMPGRPQRLDAKILKKELGCNIVRTSHYQQSHHFINACDELGLLVFTEAPGWQHIGDEQWKKRHLENVKNMVEEFRNHPSIIIWGVRINESPDSDELYQKANKIAHELDSTRATGGVRNFENSNLFEDVYTYNDFSLISLENTDGLLEKHKVTPDVQKPYLVTENNGHMYPTKSYDDTQQRVNQALRHAKVHSDGA